MAVVQKQQRNNYFTKKCAARAKLLFCSLNLLFVFFFDVLVTVASLNL